MQLNDVVASNDKDMLHTSENSRSSENRLSGICVRGNIYGENDLDYYGIVEDILKLSYLGYQNKVTILSCKVRTKLFMTETLNNEDDLSNEQGTKDYFQDDGSTGIHNVLIDDEEIQLFDANAPMEYIN
ncbi:hypothetical protein VNO78_09438 [Psophocarpus tetragonolobus]|uniref:Uncharacterized protein n=1 Tax=Psophocarpus tetragonolobus TaxID=3891 RepID=A0AAN9SWC0_PSOTE